MDVVIGWLIGIVVLAIIVMNYRWTSSAKRTASILTTLSPPEAAAAVEKLFNGLRWKAVNGAGAVNRRLRMPILEGPTVSVDFEPHELGTRVEAWTSAWEGKFGLMNFALFAVLQKRKIILTMDETRSAS